MRVEPAEGDDEAWEGLEEAKGAGGRAKAALYALVRTSQAWWSSSEGKLMRAVPDLSLVV